MGRFGLALVVSCTLVAAAGPARADDGDHQKAAAAFKVARTEIAAGNCAAAVPKLEESLAYEPSVGAHLSMADCYEQVDLLAAWKQLEDAASLAASKGDDRENIARDRAAALEPKLSMLRLVFAPSASPPDLTAMEVHVDGSLVKPYVLRRGVVATTPGTHQIEVAVAHKKPWRGQVVARTAGSSIDVDVTLEDEGAPVAAAPVAPTAAPAAAPATSPPAALTDAPAPSGLRTGGLVAGGVGVAGLAVGGIFGILALTDNAHLRDACAGNVHQCVSDDPGHVTSTQSGAKTAATVSTIGFIAGGVALGAGIVMFVAAPSTTHHLEVGAATVPGGGGLRLGGDFD